MSGCAGYTGMREKYSTAVMTIWILTRARIVGRLISAFTPLFSARYCSEVTARRFRRSIGEEVGGTLDLVPASTDIKISSGDAILPPGIAGEGVMPTPGSKVGGAVPAPGNKGPNLPSPGEPVADKEQICRNHALEAMNWNQLAIQFQCPGLNPPVWSNDHQMHFDWCMQGNNSDTAAFHNNQRAWAIQTCRGN